LLLWGCGPKGVQKGNLTEKLERDKDPTEGQRCPRTKKGVKKENSQTRIR